MNLRKVLTMMRIVFFILLCFQLPFSAAAETPARLLEQFTGEWRAEGAAFGAPAKSHMAWSPALSGKHFRIEYRIEMFRDAGTSMFEGVGYYQLAEGEGLSGFWADNSGDLHPIRAEREGDALVSHWGVEDAKQGRTRYELLSSGEIEVTDWIRTDEGWRQFNNAVFRKRAEQ